MKKNNYSLDNNILTLNTECGVHKFRIEKSTGLDKARRIAALMNDEMEKIQAKVKADGEKTSPYARLLLANLNLADACVRLEDQCRELLLEQERTKAIIKALKQAPESPAEAMSRSSATGPAPASGLASDPAPASDPASDPEPEGQDRSGQGKSEQVPVSPEPPLPGNPDQAGQGSSGPAPLVRQVLDKLKQPPEAAGPCEKAMATQVPSKKEGGGKKNRSRCPPGPRSGPGKHCL